MRVQSRIDRYDQMQAEWQKELTPTVVRRERETFKDCLNPDGSSKCIGQPIYQGGMEILREEELKLFSKYPEFSHPVADAHHAVYMALAKRADAGEITHAQLIKALHDVGAASKKYVAEQRLLLQNQLQKAQESDAQTALNIAVTLAVVAVAGLAVTAAASTPTYTPAPMTCYVYGNFLQCY
jgi:hypothetical protein